MVNPQPIVTYGISPLVGANRVKELEKQTFDGVEYYRVVLTVLELANSRHGLPYAESAAHDMINNSRSFRGRLADGQCIGEAGHPKMLPGMTKVQFRQRCHQFYENNQMFHVREVWIEPMKDEEGKEYPAIWGWVAPSGVHAQAFRDKLDNPNENVSFSLRGASIPMVGEDGVKRKHMTLLLGWDYVNEPGLRGSWKFNSRKLDMESYEVDLTVSANDEEEYQIAMESNSSFAQEVNEMTERAAKCQKPIAIVQPAWM